MGDDTPTQTPGNLQRPDHRDAAWIDELERQPFARKQPSGDVRFEPQLHEPAAVARRAGQHRPILGDDVKVVRLAVGVALQDISHAVKVELGDQQAQKLFVLHVVDRLADQDQARLPSLIPVGLPEARFVRQLAAPVGRHAREVRRRHAARHDPAVPAHDQQLVVDHEPLVHRFQVGGQAAGRRLAPARDVNQLDDPPQVLGYLIGA